jgi:hypothetical protein
MSLIAFPYDGSIKLEAYEEGLEWDVQMTISRAGRITTRQLPGARWRAKATFARRGLAELDLRGQDEALIASLRGGANTLAMYHPVRQAPLGTLRGTPVLNTAVAVGDATMQLATAAGYTVLRGDLLAIGPGGQRVMVVTDRTATGGGLLNVTFEPASRYAVGAGLAVVWNQPTTTFIQMASNFSSRWENGSQADAIELELVEV